LKKLIDNRIGTVKLVHVRGHLGNYRNEQADRLAKHGSLREANQNVIRIGDWEGEGPSQKFESNDDSLT
ncbi:19158_t:CDS:2, partial [Racocetra persica]